MRCAAGLIALVLAGSACTPPREDAASRGPEAVVTAIIDEQIIPDHQEFSGRADAQHDAITTLCENPSDVTLTAAQNRFGELAIAWSRIEWISFGPARADNRRETLFFWPDSRGRGLQQVIELAASDDAAEFEPEAFNGKSVAVRGQPALEYVLFGEGASDLLEPGAARCAFALAISTSIATTADDLVSAWTGAGGYRSTMLAAGPDNPEYRNHREALQKLLTAAAEHVQVVIDLKLTPLLRQSNGGPAPIAPPFSLAGVEFPAIIENVSGAASVFVPQAAELLPEEQAYRADSFGFEFDTAMRVLNELSAAETPAAQLASAQPTRDQIDYLVQPLSGMHELMTDVFPGALGLTMGFNALDGD